jgi:hypothetical protein
MYCRRNNKSIESHSPRKGTHHDKKKTQLPVSPHVCILYKARKTNAKKKTIDARARRSKNQESHLTRSRFREGYIKKGKPQTSSMSNSPKCEYFFDRKLNPFQKPLQCLVEIRCNFSATPTRSRSHCRRSRSHSNPQLPNSNRVNLVLASKVVALASSPQ